jgi:hypothetical protein
MRSLAAEFGRIQILGRAPGLNSYEFSYILRRFWKAWYPRL